MQLIKWKFSPAKWRYFECCVCRISLWSVSFNISSKSIVPLQIMVITCSCIELDEIGKFAWKFKTYGIQFSITYVFTFECFEFISWCFSYMLLESERAGLTWTDLSWPRTVSVTCWINTRLAAQPTLGEDAELMLPRAVTYLYVALTFPSHLPSCGTYLHAVLIFMWYLPSCGTYLHVVLVFMRYFPSCGTYLQVVLILMWCLLSRSTYLHLALTFMWYLSLCGTYLHVVLTFMWYVHSCGTYFHVIRRFMWHLPSRGT